MQVSNTYNHSLRRGVDKIYRSHRVRNQTDSSGSWQTKLTTKTTAGRHIDIQANCRIITYLLQYQQLF
jgi:hypothetical protein